MTEPTPADVLARLANRELPAEERRQLIRDWIAAVDDRPERGFSHRRDAPPAAGIEVALDSALTRLEPRLEAIEERMDLERATARELLAELLELPDERQQALVMDDRRYWTPEICRGLMAASIAEIRSEPQRAVHLASLAVEAAERVADERVDERSRADLMALATVELANALRVAGDLVEAEALFERAQAARAQGTGDPTVAGRLLACESSLRQAQGRFAAGLTAARRGRACYRRVGDRHQEGRLLVAIANSCVFLGRFEAAEAALESAAELLDFALEPFLYYGMHHNRLLWLTEAGRLAEAEALLPRCRELAAACGIAVLDRLRLAWLEGRVAAALGRSEQAEALWLGVREEFRAREMHFDAALVTLELAVLYAEQQRHAEVRRLAEELVPAFASRKVHREALGALQLFREAAKAEAVEVGLLKEILAYLVQARGNPKLRFRG